MTARMMLGVFACVLAAGAQATPAPRGAAARRARPRCFGARSRDPLVPCDNPRLRVMVVPSPDAALLEPSEPCTPIGEVVGGCRFGVSPSRSQARFALVGDSHAVHWRAALKTVAIAFRWTGYSVTHSNCPFTLATPPGGDCHAVARPVLRWLARRSDIRTVFVSGNAVRGAVTKLGEDPLETRIEGFERAFQALPPTVDHIFVIRDVPRSNLATQDCVRRAISHRRDAGAECARERADALPDDPAFIAAQRIGGRVSTLDLTPFMCDETWCFPVVGGALVIKDIGHLTRTFARTLGPYLLRALTPMVPSPQG